MYYEYFIMYDKNIQDYLKEYKPSHTSLIVSSDLQNIQAKLYDYIMVQASSQEEMLRILNKIYHNLENGSVLHILDWFSNLEDGPMLAFQSWSSSLHYLKLHTFPVHNWNERAFIVQKIEDYDKWSDV